MADAVVLLETPKELQRIPLVDNERKFGWITQTIAEIVEDRTPAWWWALFLPLSAIALFGLTCIGYQISNGVGVWGENKTVGWAWDITNFVFWIGIGHAGTLISAILFLCRQKWRTSINRASEAMTLFAVICAGIFPGIHVGRVWMAWFLAPVPTANAIWPNFRSPLLWDVFAVSTYFTVSVLFWYTGLVPDLGTLRDRAKSRVTKYIYGIFALGWRGSNRHWRHYEMAYLILAGLSTPLVLSVHSIVSFDFATSILPGWHTTIFPPYFVAGAIFGGFAMVLTILIPARLVYPKLDDLITREHVDKMAKIILLTGCIVGYAYLMELFIAYYSGNPYEQFTFFRARLGINNPGWYRTSYYCMMFCNVISPQIFWIKSMRRNLIVVFIICQFVNTGMWFERFVIIVTSLAQDFLPSSWRHYSPSWVEIWTFIGTFGIFLSLFLLFMRFLPMIAASEVKLVVPEADPHHQPTTHH
jgi:molybdopterin-containing oxidoreductase family membrane subunit